MQYTAVSANFYFDLCVKCYKKFENLYCIVLGINFPDAVSFLFFFSTSLNLMYIKSLLQDHSIAQVSHSMLMYKTLYRVKG